MAFQRPALPPVARPQPVATQTQNTKAAKPQAETSGDSDTWILFPKSEPLASARAVTADKANLTATLSSLNEYESLNSLEKTADDEGIECGATLGSEDDGDETDSLDDGLNAFREETWPYGLEQLDKSGSVFPRHDGLGRFQATNEAAQDHMWQHERYNPRKLSMLSHQRRPSSVKRKLDEIQEHDQIKIEEEKRDRIEQWRLQHSQLLLDEIEKQTQRRQSMTSNIAGDGKSVRRDSNAYDGDSRMLHGGDCEESQDRFDESESLLQKITRRVIRNFIGIDDETLSVIFGEALPAEEHSISNPRPVTLQTTGERESASWQSRLLKRLAREIGILFDHLYESNGNTSIGSLADPLYADYAGIPTTQPTSSRVRPPRHSSRLGSRAPGTPTQSSSVAAADSQHAIFWGMEEATPSTPQPPSTDVAYWSQSPNLSNVLSIFRTHLRPSEALNQSSVNVTSSSSDTIRRAALIRQQHPLVNHRTIQREGSRLRSMRSLRQRYQGYATSSCGSQSWRNGRWGTTISTTSAKSHAGGGSDRNFWDIAGSAAGSTFDGPGVWGEV